MNNALTLDHVAILVRDIDRAVATFTRFFGYRQATLPVVNSRHETEVVFLEKPDSLQIKLIKPTDAGTGGRLGLHHLAFRCQDVELEVQRLRAMGARVLSPPEPGEAFDGELIAFLYVGLGLNVEMVDTVKRRSRVTSLDE